MKGAIFSFLGFPSPVVCYMGMGTCSAANQSEQTGLWFQTEGEKRCGRTGSMRNIKSFFNIKACLIWLPSVTHTDLRFGKHRVITLVKLKVKFVKLKLSKLCSS